MKGTCPLCHQPNKELHRSHFVPAATYRLLRTSASDPNPVIVKKEISLSTSQQIADPLLCGGCEQLFQAKGEGWVLDHCRRSKGSFKLHSMLTGSGALVLASPQMKLYAATRISSIDCDSLIYFAASVFWRASAHQWHLGRHGVKQSRLGARYEEEFRQFLLGGGPFPNNATLWVSVADSPEPLTVTLFPWSERKDGYHLHKFAIPGVGFDLFVGNEVPNLMRRMSITDRSHRMIIMSPMFEKGIEYNVGRLMAKTRPSKKLQRI